MTEDHKKLSVIPNDFINIQYLRFFACLIVVFDHCFQFIDKHGMGQIRFRFDAGAAGVDIFFPISGFIMCVITDRRERKPINFFIHRIGRVAPLYWILTIILSIILLKIPSLFLSSKFTYAAFISSLLFFAWPHYSLQGAVPLLMPGWTLNYEFFFYSFFAISMALSINFRYYICSFIMIIFVILGYIFKPATAIPEFYTSPILLEFIYGIVVAALMKNNRLPSFQISMGFLIAGFAILISIIWFPVWLLPKLRPFLWGLPCASIVLGAVGMEYHRAVRQISFFRALGDASYSIYLTNLFSLGFIGLIWSRLHLSHRIPDVLILLMTVTFSVITGYIVYAFVERPISKHVKSFLTQRGL